MDQGLIYDVGVNDGADTAFYLSLGYRVVGIEASPVMAEQLRRKFAMEIASKRFTLLNVGVAGIEGQMDFWISENHEWSSFNREIASRNGTPHRAVSVPTRLFREIIASHGIPYYCKIDIEGNDRFCLAGLTPETSPEYISVEMSHGEGGIDLKVLRELGYKKFKIVSQVTRAQPIRLLTWLGYALPPRFSGLLRRMVRVTLGVRAIGSWKFVANSSGSFGEQTPGSWRSYEATEQMWYFLRGVDLRYGARGLGEWFDIHASKGAA